MAIEFRLSEVDRHRTPSLRALPNCGSPLTTVVSRLPQNAGRATGVRNSRHNRHARRTDITPGHGQTGPASRQITRRSAAAGVAPPAPAWSPPGRWRLSFAVARGAPLPWPAWQLGGRGFEDAVRGELAAELSRREFLARAGALGLGAAIASALPVAARMAIPDDAPRPPASPTAPCRRSSTRSSPAAGRRPAHRARQPDPPAGDRRRRPRARRGRGRRAAARPQPARSASPCSSRLPRRPRGARRSPQGGLFLDLDYEARERVCLAGSPSPTPTGSSGRPPRRSPSPPSAPRRTSSATRPGRPPPATRSWATPAPRRTATATSPTAAGCNRGGPRRGTSREPRWPSGSTSASSAPASAARSPPGGWPSSTAPPTRTPACSCSSAACARATPTSASRWTSTTSPTSTG